MRGGDARADESRGGGGTPAADDAQALESDPVSELLVELARAPDRDPGAMGLALEAVDAGAPARAPEPPPQP